MLRLKVNLVLWGRLSLVQYSAHMLLLFCIAFTSWLQVSLFRKSKGVFGKHYLGQIKMITGLYAHLVFSKDWRWQSEVKLNKFYNLMGDGFLRFYNLKKQRDYGLMNRRSPISDITPPFVLLRRQLCQILFSLQSDRSLQCLLFYIRSG